MIYLLRHGEIQTGNEFRLVGQRDLPLTELGRRQARWWQKELVDVQWEGVYSSDLQRTRWFAATIAGIAEGQVATEPELREILLGQWEGLSRAELEEQYPEQWAARGQDIAGYRTPGGESFKDVQRRALPALQRIAAGHEAGDVLVVAHAGVNRVILSHLLGQNINDLFDIDQAYACLNLLAVNGDELTAMTVNLPCGAS